MGLLSTGQEVAAKILGGNVAQRYDDRSIRHHREEQAFSILLLELGAHTNNKLLSSDKTFQEIESSLAARKDEQSVTGKAIRTAMLRVPAPVQEELEWSGLEEYLDTCAASLLVTRTFFQN